MNLFRYFFFEERSSGEETNNIFNQLMSRQDMNFNASQSDSKLSMNHKSIKRQRKMLKSKKTSDKETNKPKRRVPVKSDLKKLRSRSDVRVQVQQDNPQSILNGGINMQTSSKCTRQQHNKETAKIVKELPNTTTRCVKDRSSPKSPINVVTQKNKRRRERRTTNSLNPTQDIQITKQNHLPTKNDTSPTRYLLGSLSGSPTSKLIKSPAMPRKSSPLVMTPTLGGKVRWADIVASSSAKTHPPQTMFNNDKPSTSQTATQKNGKDKQTNTGSHHVPLSEQTKENIGIQAGNSKAVTRSSKPPWCISELSKVEDNIYAEFFPSLNESSAKKSTKDNSTRQKRNDRNKSPWYQVTKSPRPKYQLDIPIERRSLLKEKKQRIKDRRKWAKLKNRGNNRNDGKTCSERVTSLTNKEGTRGSINQTAGCRNNVRSTITGKPNSFEFHNPSSLVNNKKGILLQSFDTGSQFKTTNQNRISQPWEQTPSNSATQFSNSQITDSSHDMDVCSQLSAMSVDCKDEPIRYSINPRTRLQKESTKLTNAEGTSPGLKKTSARYRALLRRDLGKVDAKTGTEILNHGRWVKSHQTEKTFDRFDSHQQRRALGGEEAAAISANNSTDPEEGSSYQECIQNTSELPPFIPQLGTPEMEFVIHTLDAIMELERRPPF